MNKVTLDDTEIEVFTILDAKDHFCPIPLLKTKKEMANIRSGNVLQIDVTDQNSQKDIFGWCERSKNAYLGDRVINGITSIFIRKS